MRWGIVLLACLLATTGALAQDRNAEFTAAALKCWNRPYTDQPTPKLVWNVEINDKGELVDITAKTPEPANGRVLIDSLRRALQRCAPYDFPAGVYKITVDRGAKGGKSLDPYK